MKNLHFLFALIVSIAFSIDALAQTTWSLQSCIDHAFEHNLQIKQSELGTKRAQINHLGAVGSFHPSVNASGSHGYNLGQVIDPLTNQFVGGGWEDRVRSNNFGLSKGDIPRNIIMGISCRGLERQVFGNFNTNQKKAPGVPVL